MRAVVTQVRLNVLGRCAIHADGRICKPSPTIAALLTRLALAEGKNVSIDQIVADLWPRDAGRGDLTKKQREQQRTNVQRCVSEFRRLLDPQRMGAHSTVLCTERGKITEYRLALTRDQIDLLEFADLISRSQNLAAGQAIGLLRRALELCPANPLPDCTDLPFATKVIGQLVALRAAAEIHLAEALAAAGRLAEACAMADHMLRRDPDNEALQELIRVLSRRSEGAADVGDTSRSAAQVSDLERSQSRHLDMLLELADSLAQAVGRQWDQELELRDMHTPPPLPISWLPADAELTEDRPALMSVVKAWPTRRSGPASLDGPVDLSGAGGDLRDILLARIPTGRLVVLGEPGAGKTMLLIRLIGQILHQRHRGEAVPVLFSLTSWDPTRQSLRAWLVEQLVLDYPALRENAPDVVQTLSRAEALLDQRLIVPLLDGLDEMPEAARRTAIIKINAGLRPWDKIVLACRADEFRSLVRQDGVALKLSGAAGIVLSPVDAHAAAAYLRYGTDGYDVGAAARWDRVVAELGCDTAASRAFRTPLMVNLAGHAYNPHDAPLPDPGRLCDTSIFPTESHIRGHLLDVLITSAYQITATGRRAWAEADARRWLGFLACRLEQRNTTEFAWWRLRTATPRHLVAATVAIVCGLGVALAVGFAGPMCAALGAETTKRISISPGIGILTGLTVGLLLRRRGRTDQPAIGLAAGLAGGLVGGFGAGIAELFGVGNASWPTGGLGAALAVGAAIGPVCGRVGGFAGGLLGGLAAGLIGNIGVGLPAALVNGLAVGLFTAVAITLKGQALPTPQPRWSRAGLIGGAAVGLALGVAAALVAGLWLGIVAAITVGSATAWITGLTGATENTTVAANPRILLSRDRRAFIQYWAAGTAVGALIGTLADGLDAVRTHNLAAQVGALIANGLPVGIAAAIVSGVLFGFLHAAWGSFTIARLWLAASDRLPWRLSEFLDDAHRHRGVLRQIGPIYQFRHLELQQHFADSARSTNRGDAE